jgi:integrase
MEITGRSAVSKKYANTQQFIDEVLRYFGTRFSSGDPFRPVHLRAIYDDEDNSTVIVVWDGQGTTTEGTTYQNTYAWFMTLSGGKVVTVPLAPRTARAIDLAIGERSEGPVFLAADGGRLDRHGAGRMVRRVARRAGITKPVGPHTLRHAFITAALDAGVSLRDVQEAASHADPRTTMRYDRARGSLDRHATYIVAAYVAGAAR